MFVSSMNSMLCFRAASGHGFSNEMGKNSNGTEQQA